MRVKSIEKKGPELFLVTYEKRFWETNNKKRFAVRQTELFISYGDNIQMPPVFNFRDTGDIVFNRDGYSQLKWMVKNNIEFFDNETCVLTTDK